MKKIVCIFLIMCSFQLAFADDTIFKTVKLIKVVDGDTIRVDNEGIPMNVRFVGVDSLETKNNVRAAKQAEFLGIGIKDVMNIGNTVKEIMQEEFFKQQYVCIVMNPKHLQDSYGRYLAVVFAEDCDYAKQHIITDGGMYQSAQDYLINNNLGFKDFRYKHKNSIERYVFENN